MKKIVVVYKHKRSFVYQDIELLSKHFDVTPFYYKNFRDIYNLYKALKVTDIVFIWFASYHAFITTLLSRKPKIIVTGGFDVAKESRIRYGLLRNPIFKWMVNYILKKAKLVLSVSDFNNTESIKHLNIYPHMIYNAIDTEKFESNSTKDNNLVISVGNINKETWIRKGFSKFVELAELSFKKGLPFKFVAIGKIDKSMRCITNSFFDDDYIIFTDYVSNEKLQEFYKKAKVYCQLSYYESFGVSLIEAMASNCIPVVTDKGALPEVVGNTGFIVDYDDVNSMLQNLIYASKINNKEGVERVKALFDIKLREKRLKEILESI